MSTKLVQWLRTLANEGPEIIKIEIGERGNSQQVANISFENNPEELSRELVQMAQDAGWGTQHPKARFYAVDSSNKTLRTKQITIPINGQTTTQISDIQAIMKGQNSLLNCIVEQSRIQSASLETLSESLAHRELALATVLETLIDAERENAEVSAANMILEHHLDIEQPQENAYQSAAIKVLDGLAKTFSPSDDSTTAPSDEQVAEWYKSDEWFRAAVDKIVKTEKPTTDEPHPVSE